MVTHLQDDEKSKLWIIRYLAALLPIRKKLNKPFRNCSRKDIRNVLDWMKTNGYKRFTYELFRMIIKSFYKLVYGKNEFYPHTVSLNLPQAKELLQELMHSTNDNV